MALIKCESSKGFTYLLLFAERFNNLEFLAYMHLCDLLPAFKGMGFEKTIVRAQVCCFRERGIETCADCPDYPCQILLEFWSKRGWKYKQYRKQLEFIRHNGYEEFLGRQLSGKDRVESWKLHR